MKLNLNLEVETVEKNRIILVDKEEQTYVTIAFNDNNKSRIRAVEDNLFVKQGDKVEMDLSPFLAQKEPEQNEGEEAQQLKSEKLVDCTRDELVKIAKQEEVAVGEQDSELTIAQAIIAKREGKPKVIEPKEINPNAPSNPAIPVVNKEQ